jgi:hypothetical protein
MTARLLLPLLLLGALPTTLAAQLVQGRLLDEATEKPIVGGTMTLLSKDTRRNDVTTDSTGAFVLRPTGAGQFRLRAAREGYLAATSPELRIGASDTLQVEFLLSTEVVVLDPIVVKARPRRSAMLSGFDRRVKQRMVGVFITRDEIERRHPATATSLLSRIPGVHLQPRNLGDGNYVTVRGGCSPTVWVDGIRVPLMGMSIDDLISPLELEGIEVYKSAAEAPAEYGGIRAGCAVILLWSRHGE